jgi:hypothetical protein
VRNLRTGHSRIGLLLKIVVMAVIVTVTALAIAQDQETVELRSAIPAEDPAAAEYLAALVAADLVAGNHYDVLVNGDQVFPAMLQAIANARERISFETYVYDTGHIAEKFTGALEQAARGVTVNVVLDAIGTGGMEASHLERLQMAGCHVVSRQPLARTERRGERRRHEPAACGTVSPRFRTGPSAVAETVTGDLAQTAADEQGTRTLLELLRRSVLVHGIRITSFKSLVNSECRESSGARSV